jgi:hypothetical protein
MLTEHRLERIEAEGPGHRSLLGLKEAPPEAKSASMSNRESTGKPKLELLPHAP